MVIYCLSISLSLKIWGQLNLECQPYLSAVHISFPGKSFGYLFLFPNLITYHSNMGVRSNSVTKRD